MLKNNKLILCKSCDSCPEVYVDNNMVVLTDDNDLKTDGIRRIKLTKEQYRELLKRGHDLLSD